MLERLGVLDLGNTVVFSIPLHPLNNIMNYWFNSGYHIYFKIKQFKYYKWPIAIHQNEQ